MYLNWLQLSLERARYAFTVQNNRKKKALPIFPTFRSFYCNADTQTHTHSRIKYSRSLQWFFFSLHFSVYVAFARNMHFCITHSTDPFQNCFMFVLFARSPLGENANLNRKTRLPPLTHRYTHIQAAQVQFSYSWFFFLFILLAPRKAFLCHTEIDPNSIDSNWVLLQFYQKCASNYANRYA